MQQNSILSVIQIPDNQCLVNNIAKAHGGKQLMELLRLVGHSSVVSDLENLILVVGLSI